MNKYLSLQQFFYSSDKNCVTLTFSEIEGVLGFSLPKSAYTYGAWWANGGHSHSLAWLGAGYKVEWVDHKAQRVNFIRTIPSNQTKQPMERAKSFAPTEHSNSTSVYMIAQTINVCGYRFNYIQQIIPECDTYGHIIKNNPQDSYGNTKNLPLLHHGNGSFCRFSINAGDRSGVYLWVVEDEIIYIGETKGLKSRFNMGYGKISPRNCYLGGQSTNCKMNKVVLDLYEQGEIVSLYFFETAYYKQIEFELLTKITTPYNSKNN